MRRLIRFITESVDEAICADLVQWAAFYERRLQHGQRPIYHLEAFVAKIMSVYKRYLVEIMGL